MKVSELITALQELDGNLEVYGVSDHGQTPEKVSYPQVIFSEDTEHTLWNGYVAEDDAADWHEYPAKAVLL